MLFESKISIPGGYPYYIFYGWANDREMAQSLSEKAALGLHPEAKVFEIKESKEKKHDAA